MIEYLEIFYNKLHDNLLKKYKTNKFPSVLIWFLEIKSNDRLRVMLASHIKPTRIPEETLKDLLKANLIRETNIIGDYAITAQGVWEYEIKKNIISDDVFLKHIDNKCFNTYKEIGKALSDKEKVIVFSMIAARAFSSTSPVDLKSDKSILDTWEEIINKTYLLLNSLGAIGKLMENSLFGKPGNEHKVSAMIRHSDAIAKKTKGIYVCAGTRDQKYYLDIYKKEMLSQDSLKFLFRQIFFDRKLTTLEVDNICKFCDEIASSKSIYIFNIENHIFHKPEYDTAIRDALLTL